MFLATLDSATVYSLPLANTLLAAVPQNENSSQERNQKLRSVKTRKKNREETRKKTMPGEKKGADGRGSPPPDRQQAQHAERQREREDSPARLAQQVRHAAQAKQADDTGERGEGRSGCGQAQTPHEEQADGQHGRQSDEDRHGRDLRGMGFLEHGKTAAATAAAG